MSGKTGAHLALLAANLIYGVNYTMAKIALPEYVEPFGFIFIRVSVAGLLFAGIFALFIREKVAWRDLPRLMLCGLLGVAANQLMFFYGLARTTEINASLIMITTPILVLALSHFLIGERVTARKMIGIASGACGAFLLIGFGQDLSFGSVTATGDIFILGNATAYALYLVTVKPLMTKYHPMTVITWVFFFGFFVVAAFGWEQFTAVEWQTFDWRVWASITYVVVGTTFFAYLLNIYAIGQVNPSVVSVYIYSQPLVATLVALLIGTDHLTIIKLVAGLLIFLGVYLASQRAQRKTTPPSPQ